MELDNAKLGNEMAIRELTKGLDLLAELWFIADDQSELCEEVKRVIESGISFLESMDSATLSQNLPMDAEADSAASVSQGKKILAGNGAKRLLSADVTNQAKR